MAAEQEPAALRAAVETEARRRRLRRIQSTVAVLACAAIIAAGIAFYIAVTANARTASRLARDEHAHCLTETRQDNARRRLDLVLIAADRRELAALRAVSLGRHDADDRALIRAGIGYYTSALDARLDNIPGYVNPANC